MAHQFNPAAYFGRNVYIPGGYQQEGGPFHPAVASASAAEAHHFMSQQSAGVMAGPPSASWLATPPATQHQHQQHRHSYGMTANMTQQFMVQSTAMDPYGNVHAVQTRTQVAATAMISAGTAAGGHQQTMVQAVMQETRIQAGVGAGFGIPPGVYSTVRPPLGPQQFPRPYVPPPQANHGAHLQSLVSTTRYAMSNPVRLYPQGGGYQGPQFPPAAQAPSWNQHQFPQQSAAPTADEHPPGSRPITVPPPAGASSSWPSLASAMGGTADSNSHGADEDLHPTPGWPKRTTPWSANISKFKIPKAGPKAAHQSSWPKPASASRAAQQRGMPTKPHATSSTWLGPNQSRSSDLSRQKSSSTAVSGDKGRIPAPAESRGNKTDRPAGVGHFGHAFNTIQFYPPQARTSTAPPPAPRPKSIIDIRPPPAAKAASAARPRNGKNPADGRGSDQNISEEDPPLAPPRNKGLPGFTPAGPSASLKNGPNKWLAGGGLRWNSKGPDKNRQKPAATISKPKEEPKREFNLQKEEFPPLLGKAGSPAKSVSNCWGRGKIQQLLTETAEDQQQPAEVKKDEAGAQKQRPKPDTGLNMVVLGSAASSKTGYQTPKLRASRQTSPEPSHQEAENANPTSSANFSAAAVVETQPSSVITTAEAVHPAEKKTLISNTNSTDKQVTSCGEITRHPSAVEVKGSSSGNMLLQEIDKPARQISWAQRVAGQKIASSPGSSAHNLTAEKNQECHKPLVLATPCEKAQPEGSLQKPQNGRPADECNKDAKTEAELQTKKTPEKATAEKVDCCSQAGPGDKAVHSAPGQGDKTSVEDPQQLSSPDPPLKAIQTSRESLTAAFRRHVLMKKEQQGFLGGTEGTVPYVAAPQEQENQALPAPPESRPYIRPPPGLPPPGIDFEYPPHIIQNVGLARTHPSPSPGPQTAELGSVEALLRKLFSQEEILLPREDPPVVATAIDECGIIKSRKRHRRPSQNQSPSKKPFWLLEWEAKRDSMNCEQLLRERVHQSSAAAQQQQLVIYNPAAHQLAVQNERALAIAPQQDQQLVAPSETGSNELQPWREEEWRQTFEMLNRLSLAEQGLAASNRVPQPSEPAVLSMDTDPHFQEARCLTSASASISSYAHQTWTPRAYGNLPGHSTSPYVQAQEWIPSSAEAPAHPSMFFEGMMVSHDLQTSSVSMNSQGPAEAASSNPPLRSLSVEDTIKGLISTVLKHHRDEGAMPSNIPHGSQQGNLKPLENSGSVQQNEAGNNEASSEQLPQEAEEQQQDAGKALEGTDQQQLAAIADPPSMAESAPTTAGRDPIQEDPLPTAESNEQLAELIRRLAVRVLDQEDLKLAEGLSKAELEKFMTGWAMLVEAGDPATFEGELLRNYQLGKYNSSKDPSPEPQIPSPLPSSTDQKESFTSNDEAEPLHPNPDRRAFAGRSLSESHLHADAGLGLGSIRKCQSLTDARQLLGILKAEHAKMNAEHQYQLDINFDCFNSTTCTAALDDAAGSTEAAQHECEQIAVAGTPGDDILENVDVADVNAAGTLDTAEFETQPEKNQGDVFQVDESVPADVTITHDSSTDDPGLMAQEASCSSSSSSVHEQSQLEDTDNPGLTLAESQPATVPNLDVPAADKEPGEELPHQEQTNSLISVAENEHNQQLSTSANQETGPEIPQESTWSFLPEMQQRQLGMFVQSAGTTEPVHVGQGDGPSQHESKADQGEEEAHDFVSVYPQNPAAGNGYGDGSSAAAACSINQDSVNHLFALYHKHGPPYHVIAGQELFRRKWRYHTAMEVWMIASDGTSILAPKPDTFTISENPFMAIQDITYFDVARWVLKPVKDFFLRYSDLELHPPQSVGGMGPQHHQQHYMNMHYVHPAVYNPSLIPVHHHVHHGMNRI